MGLLGIGCALPSMDDLGDTKRLEIGRVFESPFEVTEYKCAARAHFESDKSFYCGRSSAATGRYGGVYLQGCGELPDGRTVSILWSNSTAIETFSGCERRFGVIDAPTTATGATPTPYRSCAIDTKVVPFGTHLQFRDHSGTLRCCEGNDRGSAIRGRKLDFFIASTALAKTTPSTQVTVVAGCDATAAHHPTRDFVTVKGYNASANHTTVRINAQSTDATGKRAARFILAVALQPGDFEDLRKLDVGESGMSLLHQALTSPEKRPRIGTRSSWMQHNPRTGVVDPPLVFFGASANATRIENKALKAPPSTTGSYGYLTVYFFRVTSEDPTASDEDLLERLHWNAGRSIAALGEDVTVLSRLTKPLAE